MKSSRARCLTTIRQPQPFFPYQAITVINTECAAPVQVSICQGMAQSGAKIKYIEHERDLQE
jgi:hypothetical protein